MSFTLKVVSRDLDTLGVPRQQVWWPDVRMVSRIETRLLEEVMAGCWADYGRIDADYVSFSPGPIYQAKDVLTGMVIGLWPTHAAHANDESPVPWRVRSVAKLPTGIVSIQFEALTMTEHHEVEVQSHEYEPDVYLPCWNPRQERLKSNPSVTLLWVTFHDNALHMIVEQAYLLGPSGGTVDRIHGPY